MVMTYVRYSGGLTMAFLLLTLFASPPAFAGKSALPRCPTRTDDSFYQQLVKWKGQPSACKGSVGKGEAQGESRLELSWPDGSTFEQSSMLPETSVVRYSNVQGLARADEVVAAFKEYANRRGLRIDWTSPHQASEAGKRMTEFQDPDPGVNGFARFSYDGQQHLVAVSLSVAL